MGDLEAGPGLRPTVPLLSSAQRVLCLGAHPDDIEIGCGATVRSLAESGSVEIHWLVLTSTQTRAAEAAASAHRYLGTAQTLTVRDFRDGYLPYDSPSRVKEAVLAHRETFTPDLVLCPRRDDAHQDHRFVAALALQVYRSQVILEYEIPKYDGDLGLANVYAPVTEGAADRKIADLHVDFPSQLGKPWFDEALFRGIMRLRGAEAGAASGLAEAFVSRKLVIG